ncbi:MAG: 3'-5' exonuclease [Bacteroidetes bacterium]|nr:MAG: 3'-5' exonuclease [Bacteroidota bacterium]
MRMYRKDITKEELDELALIQYEGPIVLIDTEATFDQCIAEIASSDMLGFDTETRPSFRKGKLYPTSLIQLATREKAWIVRVSRMGYPPALIDLLGNPDLMKIGTGLQDDIRRMRADFRFEPGGFLDLQDYVEAFQIGVKGLKKMSGIVLGKRISKAQQVSNWDADLLSEPQLRYAATDAWICLEIYHALRNALAEYHE